MKTKRMACLMLGLLLLTPLSLFGASFDTVVVFGDSLSDNGNLYIATDGNIPDPDDYWEGRFSNGPVWVEYLTDLDLLDCILDDQAYGGAQTSGNDPPGLVEQVALYTEPPAALPDNALFVIWIGANDFLGASEGVNINALVADSMENIDKALNDLATFGAENILVCNLPNLADTPLVINSDNDTFALGAALLTQSFNNALADTVAQFSADNPAITVYKLDIYDLFQDVIANPGDYGFTNVTESSLDYSEPGTWANGDGYVFWDDIHPTTEAHAEVAQYAYDLLTAPPDDDDTGGGGGGGGGCFIESVFISN